MTATKDKKYKINSCEQGIMQKRRGWKEKRIVIAFYVSYTTKTCIVERSDQVMLMDMLSGGEGLIAIATGWCCKRR